MAEINPIRYRGYYYDAAISIAGNAMNQIINNKGFDNFDVGDMLIDRLGAYLGL